MFLSLFYFLQRIRGNTDLESFVIASSLISMWSYVIYSSGSALVAQKWSGTLELIIASQTSLYQVVLSKAVGNSFVALLAMVMNFIYARIIFQIPISFENFGFFALSIIVLLISLCSVGIVLAAGFAIFQNAFEYQDLILTPIVLLSGIFISVTSLPMPLQVLSYLFPMTWGVKTVQSALTVSPEMMVHAGISLGVSLLFFLLAFFVINKLEKVLRENGKWRQI